MAYPNHVYQISQRSLKRAEENGIHADQILKFLNSRTLRMPEKITAALQRQMKAKA